LNTKILQGSECIDEFKVWRHL